jgi:hypothetical protein
MKDFHQIQLEKIDKYFHSGVDAPCGEGAFVVQKIDSGYSEEATTMGLCTGVHKKGTI